MQSILLCEISIFLKPLCLFFKLGYCFIFLFLLTLKSFLVYLHFALFQFLIVFPLCIYYIILYIFNFSLSYLLIDLFLFYFLFWFNEREYKLIQTEERGGIFIKRQVQCLLDILIIWSNVLKLSVLDHLCPVKDVNFSWFKFTNTSALFFFILNSLPIIFLKSVPFFLHLTVISLLILISSDIFSVLWFPLTRV